MQSSHITIDAVDQLLPQTQCTQCGYPRCLDYARALVAGETDINRCPPGGDTTIDALAELLNAPKVALDESCGVHKPLMRAVIDEDNCIGCVLCIRACPVDCIIGAAKLMHDVIADECTGCELCLPVCPTDCISMVERLPLVDGDDASRWTQLSQRQVDKSRMRTQQKVLREQRREQQRAAKRSKRQSDRRRDSMRAEILDSVARVRQKQRSINVTMD